MSGWIPIPELDQALILMVRCPSANVSRQGVGGEGETARLEKAIEELSKASDSAVYVFHDPPEAGDEAEEWLGAWTDRIALAPQAFGSPAQRINGALRRIFSRANTRKALIADMSVPGWGAEDVTRAFLELDGSDLVALIRGDGSVPVFGATNYFADFQIDLGHTEAAVALRQFAAEKGLKLVEFARV